MFAWCLFYSSECAHPICASWWQGEKSQSIISRAWCLSQNNKFILERQGTRCSVQANTSMHAMHRWSVLENRNTVKHTVPIITQFASVIQSIQATAAPHKQSSPGLCAYDADGEPFLVAKMPTKPPGILHSTVKYIWVFFLRNFSAFDNE